MEILRNAFRHVMDKYPFTLDAVVVLPDHLHCIWTLPQDDADFATRWRLVKSWFTRHCDMAARVLPDAARLRKGEQAIWQHRYWEHLLRDEADYRRHVEYIHVPIRLAQVSPTGSVRPCRLVLFMVFS